MSTCQVDGCTTEATRTVPVNLSRLNLPNTTIGVCEHHWRHGLVDRSPVSAGYELGGDNELRIAELEANRWAAFTDDELDLLEGELPRTANLRPFIAEILAEQVRREGTER